MSIPRRIRIASHIIVFADPPTSAALVDIERKDGNWIRFEHLSQEQTVLNDALVNSFLESTSRPILETPDAENLGLTPEEIEENVDSSVIDDYSPSIHIVLEYSGGESATVRMDADGINPYMLPWLVGESKNYDARISSAIAQLLPEDFLNRHRLIARYALLNDPEDRRRFEEARARRSKQDDKRPSSEGGKAARQLSRLFSTPSAAEVREIIATGLDVNARDEQRETPLMRALTQRSNGIVGREKFDALIALGADVNAKAKTGYSGIHVAMGWGPSFVDIWLSAGADINAADGEGCTPLMLATRYPAWVSYLLKRGADPNRQDLSGRAALSYAAEKGHIESIGVLLAANVDVQRQDNAGKSAFDYLSRWVHETKVELAVDEILERRTDFPEYSALKSEALTEMLRRLQPKSG